MTLEPKTIEPGWAKRWAREAVQLLEPNFHLWMVLSVVGMVLAIGCTRLPFGTALTILLSYFLLRLGQEMALSAMQGPVRIAELKVLAYFAFQQLGEDLRRNQVVFILMAGIDAAEAFMTKGAIASLQLPDSVFELVTWHPLVGAALCMWVFMTGPSSGVWRLSQLVYPLMRMHRLGFDEARELLTRAVDRNYHTVAVFSLAVDAGGIAIALMLPFLTVPLMCIWPALTIVVCRELYGDGHPCHRKVTRTVSQFTPAALET